MSLQNTEHITDSDTDVSEHSNLEEPLSPEFDLISPRSDIQSSEISDDESVVLQWLTSLMMLSSDSTSRPLTAKQHNVILDFIRGKVPCLFVYALNHSKIVTSETPSKVHSELLYFIIISAPPLTSSTMFNAVQYGSISCSSAISSLLHVMSSIYVPCVTSNKTWPSSMRKDFLTQLHKFMATLTQTVYQPQGKTVLFVPPEELSPIEVVAKQKDVIQRLEAVVIFWTRQIQDIISSQDVFEAADNLGPLSELSFWRERVEDLRGIMVQLEQQNVQQVLALLEHVQSSYIAPFKSVAQVIKLKYSEATDNLNFLSTITSCCELISSSSLLELPELLPTILNRVRLIWQFSSYYCNSKRISGLLRRVTNDIIHRCRSVIDLRDLFAITNTSKNNGSKVTFEDARPPRSSHGVSLQIDNLSLVQSLISTLNQSILVNKSWFELFKSCVASISDDSSANILKRNPVQYGCDSLTWDFDETPIFAQVDAFIQRCKDLVDVCEYYVQFNAASRLLKTLQQEDNLQKVPVFHGSKATFIQSSLLSIESSFLRDLENLSNLNNVALDVRNTSWYDGFSKFKSSMKELELVFVNTINAAFEDVLTVPEAVNLIQIFHYIASKDSIIRLIERKTASVFQMFIKELGKVRKEFETNRKSPVYPPYMPRSSGSAFWALCLSKRVSTSKHALELLPSISLEVRDAAEAKQLYLYVSQILSDFIQTTYAEWKEAVSSPSLPAKLDNYLLKKNDNLLESNFDPILLNHLSEIYFWNVLHFDVPFAASSFTRQAEKLKLLRESVMALAREHNWILVNINASNQGLFSEHLAAIDRKIRPGLSKFNWLNRTALEYIKETMSVLSSTTTVINQFRSIANQIDDVCNELSQVKVVALERKRLYSYASFADSQKNRRSVAFKSIYSLRDRIHSLLKSLLNSFQSDSETVLEEWKRYVVFVDKKIESALLLMLKSSFSVLVNALQGSPNTKEDSGSMDIQPIFTVYATLVNRRIVFEPSIDDFTQLIDSTCKESIKMVTELPRLNDCLSEFPVNSEPFIDVISRDSDLVKLTQQVVSSVAVAHSHTFDYFSRWQSQFGQLWDDPEPPILSNGPKLISELGICDADIRGYKQYQMQVQNEDTVFSMLYLQVDASKIKQATVSCCEAWISAYTFAINSLAKNSLTSLMNFFKEKQELLSQRPTSLDMLSSHVEELDTVKSHLINIESSFKPLYAQYEILTNHNVEVSDEETELLSSLNSEWISFNASLVSIEQMLNQSKTRFKESLMESLAGHSKAVVNFRSTFEQKAPFTRNSVASPMDALVIIQDFENQLQLFYSKESNLKVGLDLFEIETSQKQELLDTKTDLEFLNDIWNIQIEWDELWNSWKNAAFSNLNVDEMDSTLGQLQRKLYKLGKTIKQWGIWVFVKEKVDDFKKALPMITDLRNPALRERHWNKLRTQVGTPFDPHAADFTLDTVYTVGLHHLLDDISALSTAASQELSIENTILSIGKMWSELKVETIKYKNDFFRIKSVDEVNNTLEDNNVTLSTMKGSKYVTPFLRQVEDWDKTLNTVMETIDLWLLVQRQWLYMESIFSSGDAIARQLPQEARVFAKVNQNWKLAMEKLIKKHNNLALKATHEEGIFDLLSEMNMELEQIQKSLDDYLETKRVAFPRFYFLSNDDLLEILGQSRDPNSVNKHLKKFFMAASHLHFNPPGKEGRRHHEVAGMYSLENEYLKFTTPVLADGPVEEWLCEVERAMQVSLQKYLKECVASLRPIALKREKWIQQWHGQLIITAGQILWTADVTRGLSELESGNNVNALKILRKRQIMLLNRMTEMVRGDLSSLNRTKLIALITIEVHARDVIQKLITSGAKSPNEFDWTSQLRFFMEDDKCIANQNTATLNYGYEYVGNTGRLVITPLTDRCYMTLTTALEFKRGGSPQGPAGTGKTETVKDLAKALALIGIVFNCSEDFDYKSMGRIFLGLVQTGSWGCFDEFNRIDIEVLSVVAQQIHCILSAVAEGVSSFMFEGRTAKLLNSVGIFVTMNPGYAGRTELPDNLKSLFRPVAMTVPDFALIAEISLFAEGFTNAKSLSKKLVTLFSLAAQQLSKQDHYDWGMRSVKAVLSAAGQLKRAYLEMSEDILMLKALYDSNMPRLVAEDAVLFAALLGDLFPGVEVEKSPHEHLVSALEASLDKNGLQKTPFIIQKAIQLFETKSVRHGVMLVGLTSAKSTIWKSLQSALTDLANRKVEGEGFDVVHTHVINPKTIELYGFCDLATNEWKDGVLSLVLRRVSAETKTDQQWIMFDGPVDTLWVESMNTVLDDSKVLTLVNSERIAFPKHVSFLFETRDLSVASPATVSRVGIVYVDANEVGYQPYLDSWLQKKSSVQPSHTPILEKLFAKYISKSVVKLKSEWQQVIPATCLNLVQSLCILYDSLVTNEVISDCKDVEMLPAILELFFVFSFTWSFGASLSLESRHHFDLFIRDIEPRIPSKDTVFEYFVDHKKRGYIHWEEKVPTNWKPSPSIPYHDRIVPTIDTVRNSFILNTLILSGRSVLITGETGTGKTTLVKSSISNILEDSNYGSLNIAFSAQTTSEQFQRLVENRLDKRTQGQYYPKSCNKMILFIDEFNMPAKTTFGAMPPLELTRQHIDYHGWYDLDKQFFKYINNVQLAAAMGVPGGGRQEICDRLSSRLHVFNVTFPDKQTVLKIFGTLYSLHTQTFEQEVFTLSETFASSTLSLYEYMAGTLLPTPNKSHYLFNLRDISRVFQGLCRSTSNYNKESIIKLWVHECLRVFGDRLVNSEDLNKFQEFMSDQLSEKFSSSWKKVCSKSGLPPMFSNFATDDTYNETPALPQLRKILEEKLEDYNQDNRISLSLVMFKDAIDHLLRIHRVLTTPRGNLMLVGVGGSGRQSLTKLASYIAGYNVFQIEIKKNYRTAEWHQDLRNLYSLAGINNQPTVFIFSDTQVVSESFLEDVNNILATGETPNMYPPDELSALKDELRPLFKKEFPSLIESDDALWNFFINRVRSNLHVVLCLSPIGQEFRLRVRQYPSFVSTTTIDWFSNWPADALKEVASSMLGEVEDVEEELKPKLADVFVHCHVSVVNTSEKMLAALRRTNYVTPKSYLEQLNQYISLLKKKKIEISEVVSKLSGGLVKLDSTKKEVQSMSVKLDHTREILKVKQAECADLLQNIVKKRQASDEQARQVRDESEKLAVEQAKIEAEAEKASEELNAVLPALERAKESLNALTKNAIGEVRTFTQPPPLVKLVLSAVMVLRKAQDTSWGTAKQHMSNPNFLAELVHYDLDSLNDSLLKKLAKYTKEEGFDPEIIRNVSVAATSLCQWVLAMEEYGHANKVVAPRKATLEVAQKKLAAKQQALQSKKEQLAQIIAIVDKLNQEYQESEATRESLLKDAEETELKLNRAASLVSGLSGEKERWELQIVSLKDQLKTLPGDCALAAAFLVYAGPFTSEYRHELLYTHWAPKVQELLPTCSNFSPVEFLGKATDLRDWNIQGLPSDLFSSENGILVTRGSRWPLMIDPQGQANQWIKSMEKSNGLKVVSLRNSDFIKVLESSILYGTPVLLEDVSEELDPTLDPLLSKAFQKVGNKLIIKLGDADIEYNPNFKLYITTKLQNPHYTPEVSTKTTLVNFAVKEKGLEDQLLGIVVRKEIPAVEDKRNALVVDMAKKKKQMVDLEDEILDLLSKSTNILEDETLINTLKRSKITSEEIKKSLEVAVITEKQINQTREQYRFVAQRASLLFFVLDDVSKVDPMYQFSLDSYISLFDLSIQKAKKSDKVEERVSEIVQYHTLSVYKFTCRGLFEKHKLLFSFQMCIKILMSEKKIENDEYQFLLRGGFVLDPSKQVPNPFPNWIPQNYWDNITELEKLSSFRGIVSSIEDNEKLWHHWYTLATPEGSTLPGEWETKLNPAQKLVVIRSLRPDRLLIAIRDFVAGSIGDAFVEPPPFNLVEAFNDSTPLIPIIFILSPGVDPSPMVIQLAQYKGYSGKLSTVSLGQGQSEIAKAAIQAAVRDGTWVLLMNCHLSISWLPELERIIFSLPSMKPHQNFRLWLTSDPHPKFPISILQLSVKLTTEPPRGIKQNLLRIYSSFNSDHFNRCKNQVGYKRLFFALAFFHSVLIERRKFRSLGWNVPYEFNFSDLDICDKILVSYLDAANENEGKVNWNALRYLTGECNYGGRVTEFFDMITLSTYMKMFYNEIVAETPNQKILDSETYYIPNTTNVEAIIEYINSLPNSEPPSIFGQHPNADIASAIQESFDLLDTVLNLQPRVVSSGGDTRESMVLSTLAKLSSQIPSKLDYALVQKLVGDDLNPFNTVLLQEVLRYNTLLHKIHVQIAQLRDGINGIVVISKELEDIFEAIYNNAVPKSWSFAYPSMRKLALWVSDLIDRITQLRSWAEGVTPKVFWLSGFTYPTQFLTCLLQSCARANGVPVDALSFEFVVLSQTEDEITSPPAEGAYIKGLYLEGARWNADSGCLADPLPMILVDKMPIIHFKPVENKKKVGRDYYQAPLYIYPNRCGTMQRASYVTTVDLKCGNTGPEKWTLMGTALLLDANYGS
ncbi:hypothetical protein RCL1_000631 [Eukaryota sp. TZLM3-RCL]